MQKLAIRIWDTVTRDAVGNLLRPWQIRRESRARAQARHEEMLQLEQAQQDLHAIREGKKRLTSDLQLEDASDESSSPPSAATHSGSGEQYPLPSLIRDAERDEALRRTQEHINLAKTVRYAEESVEDDASEPPEEQVEFDWIHRWREGAKTVTTEELQRLWARTLAGEVKTPGTYSLRTLDFLKNLTRHEANKIQNLAPFLVADAVFDELRDTLSAHGIAFDDLLELQELGILEGVDSITLALTFESLFEDQYRTHIFGYSKVLEISADDPKKTLQLKASSLTRLGKQVMSLGHFTTNENYLLQLAHAIVKKGYRVRIGEWTPFRDGTRSGRAHSFRSLPDSFGQ